MSGPAAYVAADWGTSNLRLYLTSASGAVLDARTGQGVASLRATGGGDFAGHYAARTAGWPEALPALMCGSIGADMGWQRVPYLECPVRPEAIARSLVPVAGTHAAIARGLSCTNLHGAFDTMRGEETQLLGALALEPALAQGAQLLCLPGTHSKWAWLAQGRVERFLSAATGELYGLVFRHSVLVRDPQARPAPAGFAAALAQLQRHPRADFTQLAFECRSRQLAGEFDAGTAAGYLSGLLIGAEVRALVEECGVPGEPVVLVGEPALCASYAQALQHWGARSRHLSGEQCVRAGLHACFLARPAG